MKRLFLLALLATACSGGVPSLQAQVVASNNTSWVSGVGDDVNPGTRTAPQLTFAGALQTVISSGIIATLDPGQFGPLAGANAITKSLTIDGTDNFANITATGGNGVEINGATTAIVVTLRNLDIEGNGTGGSAVKVTGNATVRLVNCRLHGFSGPGIDFQGGQGSTLYLENCQISLCAGGGVQLHTSSTASQGDALAKLDQVTISSCGSFGIANYTGVTSYFRDVEVKNVNGPALGVAAGTRVTASRCNFSLSANGVGAAGVVYLADSDVIANAGYGLGVAAGGSIVTPRNNRVTGNGTDGNSSGVVPNK